MHSCALKGVLLNQINTHFLRIMFSSVRLREVFFAVGTREMVSASAYGRCPFMGGYKYRVFLRKRPGLQNGVRLQGVSAYKGCPLGGVRLYKQFMLEHHTTITKKNRQQNRTFTGWVKWTRTTTVDNTIENGIKVTTQKSRNGRINRVNIAMEEGRVHDQGCD